MLYSLWVDGTCECTFAHTGVHIHQSLSRIASATKQGDDSALSSSEASHSTVTEDSNSSKENQRSGRPQQQSEAQPSISHSLTCQGRTSSHRDTHQYPPALAHQPPPQSLKPQTGVRDTSFPSITMLSSDISSIQQNDSTLHSQPTTSAPSRLNGFHLKRSSGATVVVPSGELLEQSQESHETTSTSMSDSVHSPERGTALFERVVPAYSKAAGHNVFDTADHHRPANATTSDLHDLTSTTSGSSSGEGEPRPPIKGILKHTGEVRPPAAAASVPTSKRM